MSRDGPGCRRGGQGKEEGAQHPRGLGEGGLLRAAMQLGVGTGQGFPKCLLVSSAIPMAT